MLAYHEGCLSPQAVKNYFYELNSISKKIANDIRIVERSYGQLWLSLNTLEQDDVINETLINPQILLKYLNKFSPSFSLGHSETAFSTLSSTKDNSRIKELNSKVISKPACLLTDVESVAANNRIKNSTSLRKYSAYDGHNLITFTMQRVDLKSVQSDVVGMSFDEHSPPFSFSTKSQINFYLSTPISGLDDRKLPTTFVPVMPKIRSHQESILQTNQKNSFKPKIPSKKENAVPNNKNFSSRISSCQVRKPLTEMVAHESVLAPTVLVIKPSIPPPPIPRDREGIAVKKKSSSNAYDFCVEREECKKLIQYCNSRTTLTNSFISTSDEEFYTVDDSEDGKTCEEDKNLLERDLNLRKGFDFLNNW